MAVVVPGDHQDWELPLARRKKAYADGTSAGSISTYAPSFVATHATSTTKTFTLDGNATNVRISLVDKITGSPVHGRVQVIGHNTFLPFQPTSAILTHLNLSKPLDIRVSPELDNQVDITVDVTQTSPTNDVNVFVSQLFGAETTMLNAVANVPIPVQPRQYDWHQFNTFSGSGTPSIVQAGGNQDGYVVAAVVASVLAISGAAATPQLQLVGSGSGTLWAHWLVASSTASVPAKDAEDITDMALLFNVFNESVTLQWDRVIGANTFATLFMAGYTL